jgi:3-hydroxyisobutyrate dehydrogenase
VVSRAWGICPDAPASKGRFKIQLMQKDFGLAVETAERVGVKLALGETRLKVYTDTMHHERCKDLDSRVVYRFWGEIFQGTEG